MNYSRASHDVITKEHGTSVTEQDHGYSTPSNVEIKRYLNPACQYADGLLNITAYKAERQFQLPLQLEQYSIGINASKQKATHYQ